LTLPSSSGCNAATRACCLGIVGGQLPEPFVCAGDLTQRDLVRPEVSRVTREQETALARLGVANGG
jgi:hypothetical protein